MGIIISKFRWLTISNIIDFTASMVLLVPCCRLLPDVVLIDINENQYENIDDDFHM